MTEWVQIKDFLCKDEQGVILTKKVSEMAK